MISAPLYQHYKITVDESFVNQGTQQIIDIEETLTPNNKLWCGMFEISARSAQYSTDEHLLKSYHFRHFRKFRDTVKVTPFVMASSELRR